MDPRKRKRVALLLSIGSTFSREIVRGIIDFTREHEPWDIDVHSGAPFSFTSWDQLAGWQGDGVIAPVYRSDQISSLMQLGTPVVNVANHLGTIPFPTVTFDSRAIGRLCAEHLLDRELDRFAFFGPRGKPFSVLRHEGFAARLRESGHDCHVSWTEATEEVAHISLDSQWVRSERYVEELRALQTPVGIHAAKDRVAYGVARACGELGLTIPLDVCLVSVDNDEILCELARPGISSVAMSGHELGHRAAGLLEELMEGGAAPAAPILVPPRQVVQRGSSDLLAVSDPHVAAALHFIRNNSARFFTVSQVLTVVSISRRSLERRFRDALGHSIHEEIARSHVERAKELLRHTDQSISSIALESGFHSVGRFEATFRKLTGESASQFRKHS